MNQEPITSQVPNIAVISAGVYEPGLLAQINIGPAPDYEITPQKEWVAFTVEDKDDSYNRIGDMQIVLAAEEDGFSHDLATYDITGPSAMTIAIPFQDLASIIKGLCENYAKGRLTDE